MYRKIELTQDKFAIVDDYNFEFLNKFSWFAVYSEKSKCFYARTSKTFYENGKRKQKTIAMHRLILSAKTGEIVDHINHNGLDNRIENIRLVTCIENSRNCRITKRNSSGFVGVYFRKDRGNGRWVAKICVKNRLIYVGSFKSKKSAIKARKLANLRYGFHKNHGLQFGEIL